MQRNEQQRKRHRHHQERNQKGAVERRSAHPHHRRRLMQRVPPVHREFDDRQIDRAHQRQDRGGARGARRIFNRPPQRDQAEIHQKQNQHRRQPRIPFPIGAPHRPSPQRARHQREKRKRRADRGGGFGGHVRQRMPPHQRAQRR